MQLKHLQVLVALVLAARCAAQSPPCSIEELARLGGAFADVSSNGQVAIVSVANRLLVMDVSDPTNPTEVGRVEGLEGVRSHRMIGSNALVLIDDELRVIDLTDPANPVHVGTVVPIAGKKSWDRPAVDGSTAFVVYHGNPTTLVSIDLTDPANPVVLDSIEGPASMRAYVSAGGSGGGGGVVSCSLGTGGAGNLIWFIDATDPANLLSASVVGTSQYAEDITCNGSIACVFNWFNIDIYDTTDPYQPTIIGGAFPFAWYSSEIELAGDILFAGVGFDPGGGMLFAYDVSDPALPTLLGTPVGSRAAAPSSITPSGQGAMMIDNAELKAVSVDPTPAVVSTYQSQGEVRDADVEGNHLVFTSTNGTYFYDVTNSHAPVATGSVVGRPGRGWAVRIQGDLAYVAVDPGLRIYDLSPATGPNLISATSVPCLQMFDVDGDVGIGACTSSNQIVMFDLSDPTRPVVSQPLLLPPFDYPDDVVIEGDVAVVAARYLNVLDVSDPAFPRIVSTLLSRPNQVALSNRIAYVAKLLSPTSVIVDLSDPARPIVIAYPPLPRPSDFEITGDLLYVSMHSSANALAAYDIRDPRSVKLLGTFNAPYQARAVAVDDSGLIAMVRGNKGLSLLQGCSVCHPDCDQSTGVGVLDVFDFLCFQNGFVNADPYACDCDTSTGPIVCDLLDFLCFQNAFVAGCR
jgi:hypothetical protein